MTVEAVAQEPSTLSLSVQRDQQAQDEEFTWALISQGMVMALLLVAIVMAGSWVERWWRRRR